MEHKLATLDVVVSDNPQISTRLDIDRAPYYKLTINLNNSRDTEVLSKLKASGPEVTQAAIAHELGHFMGYLTKEPMHMLYQEAVDMPYGQRIQRPILGLIEAKAWEFARQIEPKTSLEVQEKSLDTYRQSGYRTK